MAGGDNPPDLSDEAIANAAPPGQFGKPGDIPPKGDKLTPGNIPPKGGMLETHEITEAAALKLIPKVQSLALTPDIFISYMCAVVRGFPGELGDWISVACRDFWFGREVNPYEVVSGLVVSKKPEMAEATQEA